jgi:DNA-binding transcriptional regulator WhiA
MSSSVLKGAFLASGSVMENKKTVPMDQMKMNVVSNATYISELFETAQF